MSPRPFSAPAVPQDAVMPATAQDVLLVISSAIALTALVFLVREARRRRDLVPIYLLAGAAIAILYEPLGDALVLAFYPRHGQTGWIDMLGHEVPIFIQVLYFWYFCPFVILFMHLARRGFTAKSWWGLWGGTLAVACTVEVVGLHLNTWLYYGHQSLVVLELPIWIPFTYVSFLFAIAAGVDGIVRSLDRHHHWLIVPAVPLLLAASHAATSFPAASALYSTTDHTTILLGSLGSMVAAVLLAYTLRLAFRRHEGGAQHAVVGSAGRPVAAAARPLVPTG